jgi:hypothetical protein
VDGRHTFFAKKRLKRQKIEQPKYFIFANYVQIIYKDQGYTKSRQLWQTHHPPDLWLQQKVRGPL